MKTEYEISFERRNKEGKSLLIYCNWKEKPTEDEIKEVEDKMRMCSDKAFSSTKFNGIERDSYKIGIVFRLFHYYDGLWHRQYGVGTKVYSKSWFEEVKSKMKEKISEI